MRLPRLSLSPSLPRLKELAANEADGFLMPMILSLIIIAAIMGGVVLNVITTNFLQVANNVQRQQAFNIAEAGVNYYLWHLSHNGADFKDGGTTPASPGTLGYGPYTHEYVDDAAVDEGSFTIYVSPQGTGSTVVKVRSVGKVKGTNIIRTVDAQIGATSFASYGLVADGPLWFGNTESADGPVHSNAGIRMDGASNNSVTSANTTYVPPSNLGGNGSTSHPGVWCDTSVTTPVNCNTRSKADWLFPKPLVDFNQVSGSLCTMKKVAFASDSSTSALATQANACTQTPTTRTPAYLPQRSTTGSYSLTKGYLIILNNNNTYDLYQVNAEDDSKTPYTSALTRVSVATGIAVPTSGVIFAEDNVWVLSSTTYHGRVTIGAGRLATTSNANIVISGNLLYSTKNGSDAIGLVGEDSVIIAPYAPPASGSFNYEIDAAILAETGEAWYPGSYRVNSNNCTRGWVSSGQKFLFYGSVATRQTWTWTWLDGGGACGDAVKDTPSGQYISGILNNTTQYDDNLLYAPPPSYPITGGYNILSWREVLTTP